jgi:DNA-binding HxlR family transcriptional regulator
MHVDSTPPPVRVRAGGTVLSLLASPLCASILRAHVHGPLRLPDLRERIGGAAQTTLRGQVGNLRSIGALERHVRSGMPYTVENELTDLGRAIVGVADTVEIWLSRAPQGPIAFGSEAAKGAIRALVAGWGSTILRALAARPLSLTELDSVVSDISYPSLERRLSAMRAARQVELLPSHAGTAKPYAVTEWACQAVWPLVAAGRCECDHLAETTDPLMRVDIEAAFLLAVPLIDLPADARGSCLLAVGTGDDEGPAGALAGVEVEVEQGEVVSCVPQLGTEPGSRVIGTVDSWVPLILEGHVDGLRLDGADVELARALVEGMHASLL